MKGASRTKEQDTFSMTMYDNVPLNDVVREMQITVRTLGKETVRLPMHDGKLDMLVNDDHVE